MLRRKDLQNFFMNKTVKLLITVLVIFCCIISHPNPKRLQSILVGQESEHSMVACLQVCQEFTINCQLGSLAAFQKIPRPWEYAKQWPDRAHVHGAPEWPSWGLKYTLTESHVNNHKLGSTFYSFLHKKSFYPRPWHKMLSFFSVILFYSFLSTYSMTWPHSSTFA